MTVEEALFSRHRGKQVLLDSNLLLLLLIGSFERSLVTRFKRTAQFSAEDFDVLTNLLSVFRNVVTTPHVLTEVSSLANSLPAHLKFDWHQHLAQQTSRLLEVFVPSQKLMEQPVFLAFGLADSAVFAAAPDALVLTEDFRLAGTLRASGLPAMSFRDLRAISEMNQF